MLKQPKMLTCYICCLGILNLNIYIYIYIHVLLLSSIPCNEWVIKWVFLYVILSEKQFLIIKSFWLYPFKKTAVTIGFFESTYSLLKYWWRISSPVKHIWRTFIAKSHLTISAKHYIIDPWQCSKYVSEYVFIIDC